MNALIIYEQPLNELVRAALRLEHLFKQIDMCLSASDVDSHTQIMVSLIIDLLNILDRPDLKTKLGTEFNRFIAYFSRFNNTPEIDRERLNETIRKLTNLMQYFLNTRGKIAQNLRNNDFLSNVRQNITSSGGGSSVDTPSYFYWINLSADIHYRQIKEWLHELKEIRTAVELLLSIIRHSSNASSVAAERGFYHEALDPHAHCQLIQVGLRSNLKLFPEISVGRHGISIRLVIPSMETRGKQTHEDIPFQLTNCII